MHPRGRKWLTSISFRKNVIILDVQIILVALMYSRKYDVDAKNY